MVSRAMGRTVFVTTVLLGVIAQAMAAMSPPQQSAPTAEASSAEERASRATFETVCSACHDTAIVTTTRRTRAEWTEILDMMVSFGAAATEAQLTQIQQYLGRQFGRVNVNRAPADELQFVLGVSVEVAQGIVEYRGTTRVTTADELVKVPGFPANRLDALRPRIQF